MAANWGPPPSPQPPRPPRRRPSWRLTLGIAAAALIIGSALGALGSNSTTSTTTAAGPPETVTVTSIVKVPVQAAKPPATTAPTPPGPAATFGDGTWRVGKDIRPGTYRTKGADGCYWARLKDLSGEMSGIITNGNPTGPAVVTIRPSDAGFESTGCGEWRRL